MPFQRTVSPTRVLGRDDDVVDPAPGDDVVVDPAVDDGAEEEPAAVVDVPGAAGELHPLRRARPTTTIAMDAGLVNKLRDTRLLFGSRDLGSLT